MINLLYNAVVCHQDHHGSSMLCGYTEGLTCVGITDDESCGAFSDGLDEWSHLFCPQSTVQTNTAQRKEEGSYWEAIHITSLVCSTFRRAAVWFDVQSLTRAVQHATHSLQRLLRSDQTESVHCGPQWSLRSVERVRRQRQRFNSNLLLLLFTKIQYRESSLCSIYQVLLSSFLYLSV